MGHLCSIKTLDFACDDCANPFARRSPGQIEQALFPAWRGSVFIEKNDHNPVFLERKTPCVRCPAQEVHKESARGQGGRRRLQGERGKNVGRGRCKGKEGRAREERRRKARGGQEERREKRAKQRQRAGRGNVEERGRRQREREANAKRPASGALRGGERGACVHGGRRNQAAAVQERMREGAATMR